MKKIIKFSAPWCSSCRVISPIFDVLKEEYSSKISLEDINVDVTPEIAKKYGVTSLPTILFLEGEEIVNSHKGALTKTALKQKIEDFIM